MIADCGTLPMNIGGEPDEPIPKWASPIIARGPRPMLFEMEQVIPGANPSDPFNDPITRSNELKAAGDLDEARTLLMELLAADLRCLDAHAHLGTMTFDRMPKDALRHYEMRMRIGALSLGEAFDGVLAWGWIDNRPYLRCLHGYGLCLRRVSNGLPKQSRSFNGCCGSIQPTIKGHGSFSPM